MARYLTLGILALFLTPPAYGQDAATHEWVTKYSNTQNWNCCDPKDIAFIPHEVANAARVGSQIVAPFGDGPAIVTVDIIHPTEDRQGRPVITKYGCLFRAQGM